MTINWVAEIRSPGRNPVTTTTTWLRVLTAPVLAGTLVAFNTGMGAVMMLVVMCRCGGQVAVSASLARVVPGRIVLRCGCGQVLWPTRAVQGRAPGVQPSGLPNCHGQERARL